MKCLINSANCWDAELFLKMYRERLEQAGFEIQAEGKNCCIELKNLDDLSRLIDTVGEIIVKKKNKVCVITVYDITFIE